jgi:hypothetical protein
MLPDPVAGAFGSNHVHSQIAIGDFIGATNRIVAGGLRFGGFSPETGAACRRIREDVGARLERRLFRLRCGWGHGEQKDRPEHHLKLSA